MSDNLVETTTPQAETATPESVTDDGTQNAQPESVKPPRTLETAEQRIKELNAENRKWRAQFEAAEKAKADAEVAALAERGEYKSLYEKAQAQAAALETALKAQQIALLRQQVATAKKLPPPLADRLRGETLDELNADADELLQALPRPAAASLNGGERGLAGGGLSTEDARQIAGRFNINPRYLED